MASTIQLYSPTAEDKANLTADPISMMRKAGLDWKVSTLPIVAVGNDGAAYNGGDYRAIVREDTGFVFAVAKEGYTSIQNAELAELCYEITNFSGTSCTQVGSINNGKRVFFQVDLGQVNIGGDVRDVVNNNFFIGTSHDTSWGTSFGLNAQRIICMNTFLMALAGMKGKADSGSIRHGSGSKARFGMIKEWVEAGMGQADSFTKFCNGLAQREVTTASADVFFQEVYNSMNGTPKASGRGNTRYEQVLDAWRQNLWVDAKQTGMKSAGSLWSAVNAVTQWVDHDRTVKGEESNDSLRLESNLFGVGSTIKEKAYATAEAWMAVTA